MNKLFMMKKDVKAFIVVNIMGNEINDIDDILFNKYSHIIWNEKYKDMVDRWRQDNGYECFKIPGVHIMV